MENQTEPKTQDIDNDPMNRTADSLMAEACQLTNLTGWGDESIRNPLGILLESYRDQGGLDSQALFMVHQLLLKHLTNRLLILDELKRNPEITSKTIQHPLFIVSMPRTGTTLLTRLLAQDPANRPLLHWEAMRPVPPPDPETRETDPRIEEAQNNMEGMYQVSPDLRKKYPTGAREAEECVGLLMNSFVCHCFHMFAKTDQYTEWLNKQDMVPTYNFYKKQLQMLQFRIPTERWLLKSPWHMYALDALLKVFPDACVIQPHRDPNKLIPSICSLMESFRRMFKPDADSADTGREFYNDWADMLDRCIQARDTSDPARFFDVQYQDLLKEPVDTVRKIYNHFGYSFTDQFEKGMIEWLAKNPQHKYGVHKYSLEQYGLNQEEMNQRFAAYRERFSIPLETS
ncbi:MAG: sulfotransferase [Desulfobacterales bacterium]|nr:sulfotransferase [Desulfobacterales bacterium]